MLLIVLGYLFLQAGQITAPAVSSSPSLQAATKATTSAELFQVKRIYVDSFGDDPVSKEMQSMIVSALTSSKRFLVTENRDRADAILKGVALEKTSQELHAYGEGTAVGGAAGSSHGELNGSGGSISGSSNGGFVAHHAAISDSSVNTETIDRARVAIRLVNADGDVIWTTTQESKGAKYKGASADAADMCVKQLMRDAAKSDAVSSHPTVAPSAAVPAPTRP